QTLLDKRHMRLEILPYTDLKALDRALNEKEIHATCFRKSRPESGDRGLEPPEIERDIYYTEIRVQRIYDIAKAELSSPKAILTYVNVPNLEEKH
ncbi:MAG: hypothetical protein SVX43_20110, partial [Cyanobacteriota bacterium]|nr:hypothetical protein [Cyanobacteriota bacterium]